MSEEIECRKPPPIDAVDVCKRRAAGAGRTLGSRVYRVSADKLDFVT
ncbi:hypothetical protein [Halococcus salifodinae]|nr:hypothetical protein [Halococcus salifodinae]